MHGYAGPKPGPAGAGATVAALAQRIRVQRSGSISLTSGVAAEIPWNVESFKNQFTHSTTVDPEDITADVTGYYDVSSSVLVTFDNAAVVAGGVSCVVNLFVNGIFRTVLGSFAAGGLTTELTLTVAADDLVHLDAGDVVSIQVTAVFAGGTAAVTASTATRLAISRQS